MNAQGRTALAKLLALAEDENTAQNLADETQTISDEEREKFENLADAGLEESPTGEELERIAAELEEAADQFAQAADLMNEAIETMRQIAGA